MFAAWIHNKPKLYNYEKIYYQKADLVCPLGQVFSRNNNKL